MSKQYCKICGSGNISELSISQWKYFFCKSCEIVYLQEFPNEDQLNKYYQNNYQITSDNYAETEYRRIFRIPEQLKLISEISRYKPLPAKLLDFGCDKGYFLDEARRYGYSVIGVESSKSAMEYSKKIKIECVPMLNDVRDNQDIVVLWHSIEHLMDPKATMEEIRKKMNDDGYIFIRVPDFECVYRKLFSSKWIWFQPDRHYWHFSKKSIAALLEQSGFEIINIESRKPNDLLTKKMNRIAVKILKKYFSFKPTLRKSIGRIYEDLTAVEIHAIARKK